MPVKIGYLLPTRERIMSGEPETGVLLALAEKAEALGYDSVWVGDSLLARPRHEPLTLLAGVAGRTSKVELGTAVLLPAYRNPVVMAHQIATLDQISEGRVILGVGIAGDVPNIRAEFEAAGVPFEKRVGRMMEGLRLCKALWSGEPVNWDGRWKLENSVLGPTPYRPGGPPIWMGGSHDAARLRAAKHADGWFPTGPDAKTFGEQWTGIKQSAAEAGRGPDEITCAVYLTLAIDDDQAAAQQRVNDYLEQYYGVAAEILFKRQACFAGSAAGAAEWIASYIEAGASHVTLRFAGDHDQLLDTFAEINADLKKS